MALIKVITSSDEGIHLSIDGTEYGFNKTTGVFKRKTPPQAALSKSLQTALSALFAKIGCNAPSRTLSVNALQWLSTTKPSLRPHA